MLLLDHVCLFVTAAIEQSTGRRKRDATLEKRGKLRGGREQGNVGRRWRGNEHTEAQRWSEKGRECGERQRTRTDCVVFMPTAVPHTKQNSARTTHHHC